MSFLLLVILFLLSVIFKFFSLFLNFFGVFVVCELFEIWLFFIEFGDKWLFLFVFDLEDGV